MNLTLYFIPGRSWLPRWLLGEMGEPFELVTLDAEAGEHRKPPYLAVNPLGKLPALVVDGRVMTETAAICLFLADLRPRLHLAPAIGDPDRGRYLSLMVHASTALEPSVSDVLLKRQSDRLMVGWNPLKDELAFVEGHLGRGPYLFGGRFTAADVMIGGVLIWASQLQIKLTPALDGYVARLMSRPQLARLFAEQGPLPTAKAS
ncbi:glutathione S-transferase family protein [Phenylobacterium sp.]|uniref:glutathione S-transferase family protein n=1 Tax=Phenylobacterium sp. TaxID=1871053 RepID=UPI002EDA8BDA